MSNIMLSSMKLRLNSTPFLVSVNGLGCKFSVHLLMPFQTVTKGNLIVLHRL